MINVRGVALVVAVFLIAAVLRGLRMRWFSWRAQRAAMRKRNDAGR